MKLTFQFLLRGIVLWIFHWGFFDQSILSLWDIFMTKIFSDGIFSDRPVVWLSKCENFDEHLIKALDVNELKQPQVLGPHLLAIAAGLTRQTP